MYNLSDSIGTPMATKHLDADLSGTLVDQTKYHSMVGALMYLTGKLDRYCTSTCYCARYQAGNDEKHLTAVKRDLSSIRAVSIHQEAKYVSLSAVRVQVLGGGTSNSQDYGFHFDKNILYCDSKAAIAISCNPVQHSRYPIQRFLSDGSLHKGTGLKRVINLDDPTRTGRDLPWTLLVRNQEVLRAQVDQGSQIKMIQVKEMMQDNDLKNSKSKDKGSKTRSQSMDEQSRYKQDKTITRQSKNVKRHIFNLIGGSKEFEERDLNIGGDC
ncbi:hypothetical protein Tco_0246864 [Tanacetum coccineum]